MGGAADGGAASTCLPGGLCDPASKGCMTTRPGGQCIACTCMASGMLQCQPCGGAADGGAAPAQDGGAPQQIPPQACSQGGKCPQAGLACEGAPVNGVCAQCTCGADFTLSCTQAACQ
jgi:hypothetical protein